jgi:hypothetical protein
MKMKIKRQHQDKTQSKNAQELLSLIENAESQGNMPRAKALKARFKKRYTKGK